MSYNLPTPHHETARYTIGVFCQHCSTYLNTLVGIERNRVSAVRAQFREMAQQYATEIGRAVEITFYVTQQQRLWFTPQGTPPQNKRGAQPGRL